MKNSATIQIKVCGMRDARNILQVADLSPDFMGFIFYPPSPRFVGVDFKMADDFPKYIKRVGVFVNEVSSKVLEIAKFNQLDFIQLHGDESVTYCLEVKNAGLGVIKVFRVDEDFDFVQTNAYSEVVDYFLFDTKGKYYGGNAQKFNWALLKKYNQKIPFFLSGGIKSTDVCDILEVEGMNLVAIDINSGVEQSPGLKDITKLSEVINKIRL